MTVENDIKCTWGKLALAIVLAIGFGHGGIALGQSGSSLFFGTEVDVKTTTTTTTSGGSGTQGMVTSGDVEILPDDPPELNALKEKYREKVTELREPLTNLVGKYKAQLLKMKEVFQKAGDLDNLLASQKEIDAIEKTGEPGESVSETSKVMASRRIYDSAKEGIDESVLMKIGQLNQVFKVSLDELKTTLMRGDRLDDAIIVMDFVKTIPDAPKVVVQGAQRAPAMNQPGSLRVNVQVDGISALCISGDEVWFDHRNGKASAPGLHEGVFPTELNRKDWMPVWNGKVTEKYNAEIGLPTSGDVEITCKFKDGRGQAKVLEQPSASNNYTATIGLYDQGEDGKGHYGSQYMEFVLSW